MEALIVPVTSDGDLAGAAGVVNAALDGLLEELRSRGEFRGDANQVAVLPTLGRLPAARVALVGLGPAAKRTAAGWRRAVAAAVRALATRRLETAALDVAGSGLAVEEASRAAAEGAEMARFYTDTHHTEPPKRALLRELHLLNADAASARAGQIIGRGRNHARELVNAPSNELDPVALAERAQALAAEVGLRCQVLDEAEMGRLKMGGILAVTQGSDAPAKMIVLEHRPEQPGPCLALIGKAVTFDTGGISIKPSENMHRMKGDMAGGAAVIGAMEAIARLDLPLHVLGIVPASDNMPSGRAWKPGDVVTMMSGKTVECISTDAEGRMLLGDGLTYAQQRGATHLVDIATLTGACAIALGHVAAGLFTTNDDLRDAVVAAGEAAGEHNWPMPLFPEYREQIKSDIADLKNSGGRPAGAVTAAYFLREFAGDLPWAHLDIAGTARQESDKPWGPAGPTGHGVGTFVALAERMASEGVQS